MPEGLSLPGLLLIGAGTVLAYSGINDPEGGPVGVVRSVLRGQMPVPGKQVSNLGGIAGAIGGAVGGAATPGPSPDGPGLSSGSRSAVVRAAQSYLGTPYALGGASHTSIDCSGLVMRAYKEGAGISLPHLAAAQSTYGREISRAEVLPGDLVYWGGTGTAFHIALAVSSNQIIAAPTWGRVVEYQTLWKTISGQYPRIRRVL